SGWSVDPETGEKVHMGPIELTFDGPVVPPGNRAGSRGRLALFAAAGALAVASVLAFFVLRGAESGDDAARIASRSAAPVEAPPGAEPPAAAPPETPAGDERGAPEQSPIVPDKPQEKQDASPPPAPAPVTGTEPPADSGAAATRGSGGEFGFGFGQRLIDAGTLDRATEVFSRALAPLPRERYTLQMMIACEAETVRKARGGTRPDEGLFVLPMLVRGRGCYRVLWGVFESKEAAARAALPPYFVASGIAPAVVAIDRLRPPS